MRRPWRSPSGITTCPSCWSTSPAAPPAAPTPAADGGAGALTAGWADIIDELELQPGDHLITKRRRSAFHDTGLDTLLRDLGVTQVVLAGVSTSAGVESTARSAHDHGYHVVLATDAMADHDPGAHRHSLERVFPKLGETATSGEIIGFLDRRPGSPDHAARRP